MLSGCYSFDEAWKTDKPINKRKLSSLQLGDVVVTEKNWKNPMSWFGHSAIVINKDRVGEYPRPFAGYYEIKTNLWLKDKENDFTVMRYKKFDTQFKSQFIKNLNKSKFQNYCFSEKETPSSFYCSKHIWYLYWRTAKDLGYELDIDLTDDYFVTPYDLMNSKYFYKIEL